MHCSKCGQANDDNAQHCVRCGELLKSASYPQPQTSSKAIASMVISIVGLVWCPFVGDVIGLVLGYKARREIRWSQGRITGEGFAPAGIIVGWVALGLHILAAILWVGIVLLAIIAEAL